MLFNYYLLPMHLSLSLSSSPTTVKLGGPFKNTNIMSPSYFKYFNVSSLPSRQSQKFFFFIVTCKYDIVLWTDCSPPLSDPALCSAWLGTTLLVFDALCNCGFFCHNQDYLIFFSMRVFINTSAFAQGTFPCSFLKIYFRRENSLSLCNMFQLCPLLYMFQLYAAISFDHILITYSNKSCSLDWHLCKERDHV